MSVNGYTVDRGLTCNGGEDSAQEVVTNRSRGSGCNPYLVHGSHLSSSVKKNNNRNENLIEIHHCSLHMFL